MLGLHTADIIVLMVYFIGITLIGVWAARRVQNMSHFFMPRTFGKTMPDSLDPLIAQKISVFARIVFA